MMKYTIDDNQTKIISAEIEYAIDTAQLIDYGWKKEDLLKALEDVYKEKPKPTMISDYYKSSSKLNGKYPVSDRFELKNFSYMGLEFVELKKLVDEK